MKRCYRPQAATLSLSVKICSSSTIELTDSPNLDALWECRRCWYYQDGIKVKPPGAQSLFPCLCWVACIFGLGCIYVSGVVYISCHVVVVVVYISCHCIYIILCCRSLICPVGLVKGRHHVITAQELTGRGETE